MGEWHRSRNCRTKTLATVDLERISAVTVEGHSLHHVGKKLAGRMLDGRTWDELPIEADLCPTTPAASSVQCRESEGMMTSKAKKALESVRDGLTGRREALCQRLYRGVARAPWDIEGRIEAAEEENRSSPSNADAPANHRHPTGKRWLEKNRNFTDQAYRMLLHNVGKVESSKELGHAGVEKVMAIFEGMGFDQHPQGPTTARSGVRGDSRTTWMIYGLASEANLNVAGFCRRMSNHRTDQVEELDRARQRAVIEALKSDR